MAAPFPCDLHTHTRCSDGELTPQQLVDRAVERGVRVLALTDHDTLEGVPQAQRAAAGRLEVIAGIELSTLHAGLEVHVLGYFLHATEELERLLQTIRDRRRQRIARMVAVLRRLGCSVTFADVEHQARGAVLGRPHVAEALVASGSVGDAREAFDRFLADGRPAAVPKRTVALREGVAVLRRAGGVAVVAHPGVGGVAEHLDALVAAGVAGIEVRHPAHPPDVQERLRQRAAAHALVCTGGSDFHRWREDGILPGDLGVDVAVLDALRARLS